MDRSEDLIDDAYSFAKGVVESEDLTLNISRESLQQDRQLRFIAKQINKRINSQLKELMKNDREKYEEFFKEFGNNIKGAIYESFGSNKEELEDLLLFYSRSEDKLISLAEYKEKSKSTDEFIYYAAGDSIEKIKKSPALASISADTDVLLLNQTLDEFLIKMLEEYDGLKFKSISEEEEAEDAQEDNDLIGLIQKNLPEDVVDIRFTDKLGDIPAMIKQRGDISIEMEKALKNQPQAMGIKAEKVLEINSESKAYKLLEEAKDDEDRLKELASLLLDQAKLMEGLEIDDPVTYTKNIWKLI